MNKNFHIIWGRSAALGDESEVEEGLVEVGLPRRHAHQDDGFSVRPEGVGEQAGQDWGAVGHRRGLEIKLQVIQFHVLSYVRLV